MNLDIFHCYAARLHTLPGAPTLRAATSEQLHAHYNNIKARNADKIIPRFGTDPDDDYEASFFTSNCHGILEQEDIWAQCNLVWSWIDERPSWLSPTDWTPDILPESEQPATRRFRFSMLGGGQIRVTENYVLMSGGSGTICYQPQLQVTADAGEGLRHYGGVIEGVIYEMSARAALFVPGTPQSIADRVAATFQLLSGSERTSSMRPPERDNFMALLDRSESCCVCGRALRDHVSTLLGVGPDCARQMRLPHNLEAADRILKRRRELLGVATTADPVG